MNQKKTDCPHWTVYPFIDLELSIRYPIYWAQMKFLEITFFSRLFWNECTSHLNVIRRSFITVRNLVKSAIFIIYFPHYLTK